jgi:hypothetical protein
VTTRSPQAPSRMTAAARARVFAELTNGSDDTNPEYTFATTDTCLLLAIADGLIDPVHLARAQLVNRGLDADGMWVGVPRAREVHLDQAAASPSAEAAAADIARRLLHIETLDTQNADASDFHELAVWTIREALTAAYNAGTRSATPHTDGEV